MAMNYTETSSTVFKSDWYKDRVRIATSKFVNYLLNTDTTDPEYNDKIAYATRLTQSYLSLVDQLMFSLSGDVEIQNLGASIDDATLQQIVEKTIKKYIPMTVV